MNRNKLLALNTISSLILQVTTIICGFIVPRLILNHYGSEVNGLIGSITSFLSVITLLELGVGAVVQSSLYKPLADRDERKISEIIVSANKFFRSLALILFVYVVLLSFTFPLLRSNTFGWIFTFELIIATSISLFAQYYFGIVNSLLLNSAQRGYLQCNAQTITLILNTIACAFLIEYDFSIQIVRFTTAIIYLARPIYLAWYVKKNFNINYDVVLNGEPIRQKWNGIAQHIAIVAQGTAPIMVLTLFSNMSDVSIFSVYFLVINGIKSLLLSMTNGVRALMGDLWAKQELDALRTFFSWSEWAIHTVSVYAFGCTAILIVPFIKVYTAGVYDANYIQPIFGVVLTIAHCINCLRMPYNMMILSAGHYKQTQNSYIISMVLNITLSVVLLKLYGINGLAVGAVVGLGYHSIWMAYYNSGELLKISIFAFWKHILVDALTIIIASCLSMFVGGNSNSYFDWTLMALKVVATFGSVIILINYIFYKEKLKMLINYILGRFSNKEKKCL